MFIQDRLYELDARVSKLVILPLMDDSNTAENFLKECWDKLPELLQFDNEVMSYYNDYESSYQGSVCEFLRNCEYRGVFFEVEGNVYKDCTDELKGDFENLVSMYRFTGRRAVEYGYAESMDDLDEAMNKALDKLESRLFED